MNDEKPPSKQTRWLDRLVQTLSSNPENREDLAKILLHSHQSSIIDDNALQIMEGALRMGDQQAGDIMIPRSHMELIRLDANPKHVLKQIIESGHSRFPVIGESSDDILGILLAKDLLPLLLDGIESLNLKSLLRPATIIPEYKRLSVLLREFREQRYHMAIVIDEYGSVSGLVTIEDILEEIVGEIEDETDEEEENDVQSLGKNEFIVEAQIEIDEFNERFDCSFTNEEYDTIAGLVTSQFGHLPKVGEKTVIAPFEFEIVEADNRRIQKLLVSIHTEANQQPIME